MSQLTIPGGWDLLEVAAAQHALVVRELLEDAQAPIGPYAAFRWAMDAIGLKRGSLLDVGCGSGHYGVLCERFYPHINYHGTDISDAMTVYARGLAPLGRFSVCAFEENAFEYHNIILASQILEMLNDPPAMLDLLLSQARQYVILNRIRLTSGESRRIVEGTYAGNVGRNWLWNLDELTHSIKARAVIIDRRYWDGQCTFVVRAKYDESAELCSCADAAEQEVSCGCGCACC